MGRLALSKLTENFYLELHVLQQVFLQHKPPDCPVVVIVFDEKLLVNGQSSCGFLRNRLFWFSDYFAQAIKYVDFSYTCLFVRSNIHGLKNSVWLRCWWPDNLMIDPGSGLLSVQLCFAKNEFCTWDQVCDTSTVEQFQCSLGQLFLYTCA